MTANLDVALRQRVFDTVRLILPSVLGRELPAIADSTVLRGELGLRSATTLELLIELEDSAGDPDRRGAARPGDHEHDRRSRGLRGPSLDEGLSGVQRGPAPAPASGGTGVARLGLTRWGRRVFDGTSRGARDRQLGGYLTSNSQDPKVGGF